MIKIYYCHQGLCTFQCKVVISAVGKVKLPNQCLYFNDEYEPIWKEVSYINSREDG